jgi:hypothetical protein
LRASATASCPVAIDSSKRPCRRERRCDVDESLPSADLISGAALDVQGLLETGQRLRVLPPVHVNDSQSVEDRSLPKVVAGFLVERDRRVQLAYGFVGVAELVERPADLGVSLRVFRVERENAPVRLQRTFEIALLDSNLRKIEERLGIRRRDLAEAPIGLLGRLQIAVDQGAGRLNARRFVGRGRGQILCGLLRLGLCLVRLALLLVRRREERPRDGETRVLLDRVLELPARLRVVPSVHESEPLTVQRERFGRMSRRFRGPARPFEPARGYPERLEDLRGQLADHRLDRGVAFAVHDDRSARRVLRSGPLQGRFDS